MTPPEAREILGVEAVVTADALKRAYLRQVKQHPPERDPSGFQRVREAYDLLRAGSDRAPPPVAVNRVAPRATAEAGSDSRSDPPPRSQAEPPPVAPQAATGPVEEARALALALDRATEEAAIDVVHALALAHHVLELGEVEAATVLLEAFERAVERTGTHLPALATGSFAVARELATVAQVASPPVRELIVAATRTRGDGWREPLKRLTRASPPDEIRRLVKALDRAPALRKLTAGAIVVAPMYDVLWPFGWNGVNVVAIGAVASWWHAQTLVGTPSMLAWPAVAALMAFQLYNVTREGGHGRAVPWIQIAVLIVLLAVEVPVAPRVPYQPAGSVWRLDRILEADPRLSSAVEERCASGAGPDCARVIDLVDMAQSGRCDVALAVVGDARTQPPVALVAALRAYCGAPP